METPLTGPRRRGLALLGALLAVSFVGAMALTRLAPELKTFVRFAPAGLMSEDPERITRLELRASGRLFVLKRDASGAWRREGPDSQPAPTQAASHLDAALRLTRVSDPVRIMEGGEYQADRLQDYGLDPPRKLVSLYADDRRVVEMSFGRHNPMQAAQYVLVTGRDRLYLMPRFVGLEWDRMQQALEEPGHAGSESR